LSRPPALPQAYDVPAPTLAEELAAVRSAIHTLMLGGAVQNYTLRDGTSVRHYDIDQLREYAAALQDEIKAEEAAAAGAGDSSGAFAGVSFTQFRAPK
jgi:hypothetical protein